MNIFIAILIDTYSDVQNTARRTKHDKFEQSWLKNMKRLIFYNVLCGGKPSRVCWSKQQTERRLFETFDDSDGVVRPVKVELEDDINWLPKLVLLHTLREMHKSGRYAETVTAREIHDTLSTRCNFTVPQMWSDKAAERYGISPTEVDAAVNNFRQGKDEMEKVSLLSMKKNIDVVKLQVSELSKMIRHVGKQQETQLNDLNAKAVRSDAALRRLLQAADERGSLSSGGHTEPTHIMRSPSDHFSSRVSTPLDEEDDAAGDGDDKKLLSGADIFNFFDVNASGDISMREFLQAMPLLDRMFDSRSACTASATAATPHELFYMFDFNGNGNITFNEFKDMLPVLEAMCYTKSLRGTTTV